MSTEEKNIEITSPSVDRKIKLLIQKYGDQYDYRDSIIITKKTLFTVKCNKCQKIFITNFDKHYDKGFGCPHCHTTQNGNCQVS